MIEKRGAGRPLGEYLPCTREQLDAALQQQGEAHLGQALVAAGAITEDELLRALHRQRADRLRLSPLFAGLTDEDLARISPLVHERSLAKDTVLLRQDERGESIFLVATGSISVFRDDGDGAEVELAVLGPGETVGEMGYFSSGVRSASARARERTELLEIAFADVPRCLEAAPRVALPLLDIVTARLRETDLRYQIDVLRRRSVERSLEGLSSILDLSDAWKMRVGIEELIDRIVQTASRVMKAERASLFLVDETTGDLWSQVAEGEGTRVLRVPKGSGIAGWVAQHGDLLNIPDAYRDDRFNREMDRKTGFRTKSILCGPVRNLQGRIIGVVQVMNKKGGPFDSSDESLFRAFGYQAAIAVENFHLYRRVVASHGKMAVLLDVASALSETLDLPRLIQRVIAKTTEVLECDRGSLFLFDRGKGELWSMEARGAELGEIRLTV